MSGLVERAGKGRPKSDTARLRTALSGPRQRRGGDILRRATISLRDVVFGTEQEVSFRTAVLCAQCQGSCCAPGTSPTPCTVCNGSGHVQKVAQSLLGQMVTMAACSACQGHGDRAGRGR